MFITLNLNQLQLTYSMMNLHACSWLYNLTHIHYQVLFIISLPSLICVLIGSLVKYCSAL